MGEKPAIVFFSILVRLLLPLAAATSAFSDNSLRIQDNDPLATIWPIVGTTTNVASSKALTSLPTNNTQTYPMLNSRFTAPP